MSEVQELSQEFLDNVRLNVMEEETTESSSAKVVPEVEAEKEADTARADTEEELQEENQVLTAKLEELEQTVLSLNAAMQKMAGSSEAAARQLNQVNENLHRENQRLKEGLYESLLMPVLKDFITLGNDILMDISRYRKNGDEQTAEGLESTLEDIHTVLEKYGVEVYRPQEGGDYEPVVQKIVKTVDTDEENRDRKIAEVRSFGYRMVKSGTSIVLAPCKVYVYKLNKDKELV